MTTEELQQIINTRIQVAEINGNTTERSFLYELYKMSEEYRTLKESLNIDHEINTKTNRERSENI